MQTNQTPKKKPISITVPVSVWADMSKIISAEHISISQWVCMAIVREIERYKKQKSYNKSLSNI